MIGFFFLAAAEIFSRMMHLPTPFLSVNLPLYM